MRHAVTFALLVLAMPAVAQEQQWTAAPVPALGDPRIEPAARAGLPVADDNTTPFSNAPATSVERNGATSSDVYDGAQTPDLSGK